MFIRRLVPSTEADGVYVRVKNGSAQALANGDVVIWDATDDDGITVDVTTSAGSKLVAGVIVDSIAIGGYGRMQVWGYHPAVKVDGGTTDVADAALIGTGEPAGYAYTTTTLGTVLGVMLEAKASQGTAKVFIKCM